MDAGEETTHREQAEVEGKIGSRLFDYLLVNRMLSGCGIIHSVDHYLFRNPYFFSLTTEVLHKILNQLHESDAPYFLYYQTSGQMLILYVYPITDQSGTNYLMALFNPDYCSDVIGKYARTDTQYCIMNEYDRAIYATDGYDRTAQHWPPALSQNNDGVVESDGVIYVRKNIAPFSWKVLLETKNFYPKDAVTRIGKVSTIVRGMVSVLSLILMVVITRFFSRRAREIDMAMDAIENGNLDETFHSHYTDELSRLGFHLNQMVIRLKAQAGEISRKQEQVKMSQLQALQNQINPHFLYNSLEYVRMKTLDPVTGEEGEASQAIREIAEMLRYNTKNQFAKVSVLQEYEQMNRYLNIQKKLLQDRLLLETRVDEQAINCEIIKFVLQPLAENAVLHGIEPKVEPSRLVVNISLQDARIHVSIEDTGVGMDPATLAGIRIQLSDRSVASDKLTIGLKNVNDRLILFYGETSALSIWSELGAGTRISFSIPANENAHEGGR